MRFKTVIPALFLTLLFHGCISDEALNVEAAIDGCTGSDVQLAIISKQSSNKTIDIYINKSADLSSQDFQFTLSEGATMQADIVEGDTDDTYDFSANNPRYFTVTSEDGSNSPVYTITVIQAELPTEFHFEKLSENSTDYHILYEYDLDDPSKALQWSSGNPGFLLTGMAASAEDYPTVQITDGYSGNAVKLETKDTGSFGAMVGMRIAAGNLFVGSFDVTNAIQNPLEATRFGYPFSQRPVRMTGYYKYNSGGTMTDENGDLMDEQDKGDIYAVLYEAASNSYTLDGDLFPLDGPINKNIALMARIEETEETDEWEWFDLEFTEQNGKTVTDEDLTSGKYKLAVVFSSSIKGAYFQGAVGSTLWIDEVTIVCE